MKSSFPFMEADALLISEIVVDSVNISSRTAGPAPAAAVIVLDCAEDLKIRNPCAGMALSPRAELPASWGVYPVLPSSFASSHDNRQMVFRSQSTDPSPGQLEGLHNNATGVGRNCCKPGRWRYRRSKRKSKRSKFQSNQEMEEIATCRQPERAVEPCFRVVEDDDDGNLELRKLLRGPRYFNPPEELVCFCCGLAGHASIDCGKGALKHKVCCYLCGSLDHISDDCLQGSMVIYEDEGPSAQSCLNKAIKIDEGEEGHEACMRCGNAGHLLTECCSDYDPEDLKVIQCYVCKGYGHLCCVDVILGSERDDSCYNCGELGHSGVDCITSAGGTNLGNKPANAFSC